MTLTMTISFLAALGPKNLLWFLKKTLHPLNLLVFLIRAASLFIVFPLRVLQLVSILILMTLIFTTSTLTQISSILQRWILQLKATTNAPSS